MRQMILAFAALLLASSAYAQECNCGGRLPCLPSQCYALPVCPSGVCNPPSAAPPGCNCVTGVGVECSGSRCFAAPACPNGLCYAHGGIISYPVGLTVTGQYALSEVSQSTFRRVGAFGRPGR